MRGGVPVIVFGRKLRMNGANTGRLIDVELLLNSQMKAEVQERIDVARLRPPIGGDE